MTTEISGISTTPFATYRTLAMPTATLLTERS
jgi:hypothetical protein